ncbi:hypothetical protein GDO86_006863 [Hymenochirus boettgeri]|uniref:BTB domain-containing protein n=1 Tax=Hymenochirus boettgeri TaxID=247094 RepID=A0A8T2J7W5_9PIPI|nr:hypothetical protein GDO86_006863 [Hymenochirus boettgeri]
MFTSPMKETQQGEVVLPDISPPIIQAVLNYIYTGVASIEPDTVDELFTVSSRLQIIPLQDLCSSYLIKKLNNENCIWIYKLSYCHNHKTLLKATLKYIGYHITSLCEKNSFLPLDLGEITNILSSDCLMTVSELTVYQLAYCWWQFHRANHSVFPKELLGAIRFSLMSTSELEEVEKGNVVDASFQRHPQSFQLRQGMFETRIVCMDLLEREDPSLTDRDFYLDAYDPELEIWEKLPPLKSLMCPGIVALGSYMYVAGGIHKDDSVSNTLHVYDSVKNSWNELCGMFGPKCMHGFVAYNQKLYALGGWDGRIVRDSVECFIIQENCWSQVSRMPTPLCYFASTQLNGKLYLIGGGTTVDISASPHLGILIFSPSSDTWCQIPLKTMCSTAGVIRLDNKLYVIGGHIGYDRVTQSCKATAKCFCLDSLGHVCPESKIPALPKCVASAGVVLWNRRIYVLGGEDRDIFYKQVYYWEPGATKWTVCRTSLPILSDGVSAFGCVTLKIPMKQFHSLIPHRRTITVPISSQISSGSSDRISNRCS